MERMIGFADSYGTRARVEYVGPDGPDDTGMIAVALECGGCAARGYPTAEAARQLAAALLDAADQLGEGETCPS